jgi:hypothetical protein
LTAEACSTRGEDFEGVRGENLALTDIIDCFTSKWALKTQETLFHPTTMKISLGNGELGDKVIKLSCAIQNLLGAPESKNWRRRTNKWIRKKGSLEDRCSKKKDKDKRRNGAEGVRWINNP